MSLTPQDLLAIDNLIGKRFDEFRLEMKRQLQELEEKFDKKLEIRLAEMATDIYKGVGDVISDHIYPHLDKLDNKFSGLKKNLTTTVKAL